MNFGLRRQAQNSGISEDLTQAPDAATATMAPPEPQGLDVSRYQVEVPPNYDPAKRQDLEYTQRMKYIVDGLLRRAQVEKWDGARLQAAALQSGVGDDPKIGQQVLALTPKGSDQPASPFGEDVTLPDGRKVRKVDGDLYGDVSDYQKALKMRIDQNAQAGKEQDPETQGMVALHGLAGDFLNTMHGKMTPEDFQGRASANFDQFSTNLQEWQNSKYNPKNLKAQGNEPSVLDVNDTSQTEPTSFRPSPVDKAARAGTMDQARTAPDDEQAKQARIKFLEDQVALYTQPGTSGLPGSKERATNYQNELAVLTGYKSAGGSGRASVYEMKKRDAEAKTSWLTSKIDDALADKRIDQATAEQWKVGAESGIYATVQKVTGDLAGIGYLNMRDKQKIDNAVEQASREEFAKIGGQLAKARALLTVPERMPATEAAKIASQDKVLSSMADVINRYPMGEGYSIPIVGGTIGRFRQQVDPDFAAWTSSLAGVVNNYMKTMSGTAVTTGEMQRNIAKLGNPSMTDEARVAVLNQVYDDMVRERNADLDRMSSAGYVPVSGQGAQPATDMGSEFDKWRKNKGKK